MSNQEFYDENEPHEYNCASGTMANIDEFYPCNCGRGTS